MDELIFRHDEDQAVFITDLITHQFENTGFSGATQMLWKSIFVKFKVFITDIIESL